MNLHQRACPGGWQGRAFVVRCGADNRSASD